MLNIFWRFIGSAVLVVFIESTAWASACPVPGRQPATLKLIKLVEADSDLKASLTESFALGQRINDDPKTNPVASLNDYYGFIDALVTYNPRNIDTGVAREGIRTSMDGKNYCNWNILDLISYNYFLVDRQITTDPRGQIQFKNKAFSEWLRQLAEDWGRYLETPDSARFVPKFQADPKYGDWYCPTKPYPTFQAFFVRELCRRKFPTGSRPVEGYDDPRTVVSIGDSNSMGWWPISRNGRLVTGYDRVSQSGRMIKGKLYSDMHAFIIGGKDESVIARFGRIDPSRFDGGVFTHQFLNVNNYHRLHLPVAGRLVFMRHIRAGTRLKVDWKPPLGPKDTGYYDPRDTPDWQFGQTRLALGIQTPKYGVVVAVAMGMAQVSAIQLRDWVKLGAKADKGWEFANFAFGGSDFVLIFEERAKFTLTVAKAKSPSPHAGTNYLPSRQGQKYGCFGGVTDCSDKPSLPPPYPGR